VNRSDFINHFWRRYPSAEIKSQSLYGRVEKIDAKTVSVSGITKQIYSEKILLGPCVSTQYIELQATDLSNLILPEDLVTIQITNKAAYIDLIAPCLNNYARISNQQIRLHKNWFEFLGFIRNFFESKSFVQIDTPTLVDCPGTEPALDFFSTTLVEGRNQTKKFLPTSPELHLKKALCRDLGNVFEVKKCFRNNEKSSLHKNEFTMLEWYRVWSDLYAIKIDLQDLVFSAVQYFKSQCDGAFVVKTMADLFSEILSFQLTPKTTKEDLQSLCDSLGLKYDSSYYKNFDDFFHLVFVEKIEPKLKAYQTLFIEKYPPSQCAYAKIDSEGWAQRFEFYWDGVELANAFYEINDPEEQRQRMILDVQKKQSQNNQDDLQLDEDFFLAMQFGMPPSAGIALGLDRFFMKLMNLDSIQDFEIFKK